MRHDADICRQDLSVGDGAADIDTLLEETEASGECDLPDDVEGHEVEPLVECSGLVSLRELIGFFFL